MGRECWLCDDWDDAKRPLWVHVTLHANLRDVSKRYRCCCGQEGGIIGMGLHLESVGDSPGEIKFHRSCWLLGCLVEDIS